jgi:hypothetical protein
MNAKRKNIDKGSGKNENENENEAEVGVTRTKKLQRVFGPLFSYIPQSF